MKRKKRYNRGGNVGAGVGAGAGAVVGTYLLPGLGTQAGATIGGALGRGIGSLFGRKKDKEEPPPPSVGIIHPPSYGMKTGGTMRNKKKGYKHGGAVNWYPKGSVTVQGRSHEAGGESLAPLGRPDVEVEHDEVVTLGENGEPDYVFSAMQMDDKNRSFAEEYKRLEEKADVEGIKQLMKKQERQMGRVNDVTVTNTERRAQFSKYGGSLRKKKYQTGGPTGRIFYSGPGGVGTSLPPRSPGYQFISGPGGTQVSGLPTRTTGNALSRTTQGLTRVGQRIGSKGLLRGSGRFLGTLGMGVAAGVSAGELIAGDSLFGSYNRMRKNQQALQRATRRRQDTEFENFDPALRNQVTYQPDSGFRFYEHPGIRNNAETAPARPSAPNIAPEDPIINDTFIPGQSHPERKDMPIGYANLPLYNQTVSTYQDNLPEASSSPPGEAVPVEGQGGGGGGFGWDDAAMLAPYAADLLNIGIASTMKKPKKPRAVSPTMMDERVSTTADEEALTSSARAILADPNATANQKLAATTQLNRAKSSVRSEANQRRDSIRRFNTQTLNRAREYNARRDERYADRLDRHRGAKASAISASVRSMSDRFAMQQAEKRQRDLLPFQLTALMHSMPTKDRRAFIRDLRRALPKDDPLYSQMGLMIGGI